MECTLAGETEFLGEDLPQRHFCVHHKIPHDHTRVSTRAAAVRSRRLTAWAMARPTDWTIPTTISTCLNLINMVATVKCKVVYVLN
jgi:hypothetical protein